jgi:hypothetical protein
MRYLAFIVAVWTVRGFVLEVATDRWEVVAVATARRLAVEVGLEVKCIEPEVEAWL